MVESKIVKKFKPPVLIGVAGGTASGKTTVCDTIIKKLVNSDIYGENAKLCMISMDSFYKVLNDHSRDLVKKRQYNFDHPDAYDWDLLAETLKKLQQGDEVIIPTYDFKTSSRLPEPSQVIYRPDIVLFEGILLLYLKEIRDMLSLRIFVDEDSDVRLSRRVVRDINDRGRSIDSVLDQYLQFVKPAFDDYVLPTKRYADIVIPRGAANKVALNLIVQHVNDLMAEAALANTEKKSDSLHSLNKKTSHSRYESLNQESLKDFSEVSGSVELLYREVN